MKDNLFDTKITPLDVVKILMLIVTLFSTWNIIDLMTPDVPFAFVRILAAVGVVEGAFLGFEYATATAKNRAQTQKATIGFFISLTVIALFAGLSGFLEFGGPALLEQNVGLWANIQWTVREVVMVAALMVVVMWIVALASIYRLYSLDDPDKQREMQRNALDGQVVSASNVALQKALEKATPVIAIQRALATIRTTYSGELEPDMMQMLLRETETHLRAAYKNDLPPTERPTQLHLPQPATLPRPLGNPATTPLVGAVSGNGNGNGHKPTQTSFTD